MTEKFTIFHSSGNKEIIFGSSLYFSDHGRFTCFVLADGGVYMVNTDKVTCVVCEEAEEETDAN